MITVQGLGKSFGKVVAVDDVTFTAGDGQITGLLGPNGAGKTTTLRMLYGLIRPDRGTATVDGRDVAADPAGVKSAIGVLPDSRGLYPRLTAREHIEYYGRLHGLTGGDLARRTDELIQLLEMSKVADRKTQGFSQGERAKVAIGRAIVHDPRNVMLDEPTNGLDVMSTRAMRTLIRTLKEQGRCVLFSSHIMQEVSALCDRIVVIARGRVVADGTPDEIRERTGEENLEEAFVRLIGTDEGLMQ